MTLHVRGLWAGTPPIVRATLDAAWTASKVGAIAFASLFTVANLAFGAYAVAMGRAQTGDLLSVIVGGSPTMGGCDDDWSLPGSHRYVS